MALSRQKSVYWGELFIGKAETQNSEVQNLWLVTQMSHAILVFLNLFLNSLSLCICISGVTSPMPKQTSRNTAAHSKGLNCIEAVDTYSDTREKSCHEIKLTFHPEERFEPLLLRLENCLSVPSLHTILRKLVCSRFPL